MKLFYEKDKSFMVIQSKDGKSKYFFPSHMFTFHSLVQLLLPAVKLNGVKLQLLNAIYQLRLYSNSLIHILSLSNFHNNVASIQKNRDDKSHRVIAALVNLFQ